MPMHYGLKLQAIIFALLLAIEFVFRREIHILPIYARLRLVVTALVLCCYVWALLQVQEAAAAML